MKTRSLSFTLIICFLFSFAITFVQAQEDEQVVVYRQKLMKGHGASMGSIGDILKFKLPYSASHIASHAKALGEYATLIPDAFEKNISEGLTDTKSEAWQNWDDFVAKAEALNEASMKLSRLAKDGDMRAIMPGVKGVGDACKGCHSVYRKPEEERFERK